MDSDLSRYYDAFIRTLLAARNKQNLTQEQVAVRLSRPQSFVSKYENGERRLDVIEFVQVARALNADPVSLMKKMELI